MDNDQANIYNYVYFNLLKLIRLRDFLEAASAFKKIEGDFLYVPQILYLIKVMQ